MSKDRVRELEDIGIGLYLSKGGAESLSKILGDGCPVKINNGYSEPISCPYSYIRSKSFDCTTCWRNWLEIFIIKE